MPGWREGEKERRIKVKSSQSSIFSIPVASLFTTIMGNSWTWSKPWGHHGNRRNDKPQTKAMVLKSILGPVPKDQETDG